MLHNFPHNSFKRELVWRRGVFDLTFRLFSR